MGVRIQGKPISQIPTSALFESHRFRARDMDKVIKEVDARIEREPEILDEEILPSGAVDPNLSYSNVTAEPIDELSVACPTCNADPGHHCLTKIGKKAKHSHAPRRTAANVTAERALKR